MKKGYPIIFAVMAISVLTLSSISAFSFSYFLSGTSGRTIKENVASKYIIHQNIGE